ncbi:hypothetical protein PENSUB_1055 [Penicillium subrubescens]|uniref:Uncharacterized protein n=1 Tax=Penicillium subrubescens TaxID=1316194 RepID=A0A1Q5UI77_9EURO|nr:hypothetical protein PENSUB_4806 [Penicillium subrubescens]OKP12195.1 hypothetical protein PENSUB_2269 [Penicillium subrubescens]OKP13257.1 hypothetical protein PENSUB_1055 [Penicillium subrubescens]
MLSPTVEVSWNLSRNDPCQTQRAGVDDPRAHLTSRKGIQLKELEHQAKFFDRWGLFIGLVPVYVIYIMLLWSSSAYSP